MKKIFLILILLNILNTQDVFSCSKHKIPFYEDLHPSEMKHKERPSLQDFINTNRYFQDAYADSPNGLFRVHYDTTGENSVELTDNNNNGIPDYVDSCLYYADLVYEIQVNQIGWKAPIHDKDKGGSDHYDIYVRDMGHIEDFPTYGVMLGEEVVTDSNGNDGVITYIIIDNDFSPTDSAVVNGSLRRSYFTTGIPALKATISHEFHHQVQDQYFTNASGKMYEMTSVFMERRIFPESRDFIQYTRSYFKFPDVYSLSSLSSIDGYIMGLFWDFIYEKFGSDEIILRTWNIMSNGVGEISALDQALQEANSTLNSEWCDFAEWCYNAGISDKEPTFSFANELPSLEFQFFEVFDQNISSFSRDMEAYTFGTARIIIPAVQETTDDSLDVLFANINFDDAVNNNNRKNVFGFAVGNVGGDNLIQLQKIDQVASVYDDDGVFCYDLKELSGVSSEIFHQVYPSPFSISRHNAIYLPVPENSLLYDDVELRLMNIEMMTIFTDKFEVEYHNGHRMIIIENKLDGVDLKAGVYIFEVYNSSERYLYKFSVTN